MKNFKQAAYKVLIEASQPLHSKEITKRALRAGYLQSAGKTPEATMDALLTVDINEKKEKSLFIKTAPSTFGLKTLTVRTSESIRVIDEAIAEKKYPISPSMSFQIQKQIVAKLSAVQEYKTQLLAQKSKLKELFDSALAKSFRN